MFEIFGVYLKYTIFEHVGVLQYYKDAQTMLTYIQSFKSLSLCNMYFCGLLGSQIQGPPWADHTQATPLFVKHFYPNERPSC